MEKSNHCETIDSNRPECTNLFRQIITYTPEECTSFFLLSKFSPSRNIFFEIFFLIEILKKKLPSLLNHFPYNFFLVEYFSSFSSVRNNRSLTCEIYVYVHRGQFSLETFPSITTAWKVERVLLNKIYQRGISMNRPVIILIICNFVGGETCSKVSVPGIEPWHREFPIIHCEGADIVPWISWTWSTSMMQMALIAFREMARKVKERRSPGKSVRPVALWLNIWVTQGVGTHTTGVSFV